MSENLCYTDAYARRTDGRVVAVDPDVNAILLARTVLCPGGGGQSAHTGVLTGDHGGTWKVSSAMKRGDDISHTIEVADALPTIGAPGHGTARSSARAQRAAADADRLRA